MRVLDGLADGNEQFEAFAGGELVFVAEFRERLAFDEFHDEVRAASAQMRSALTPNPSPIRWERVVGNRVRVFRATTVEHLGDVWMIHECQRLTFGLEARNDLPRIHAELDDFQRHAAANRFFLFGHIDDTHAAFADLLKQFVAANAIAGLLRDHDASGGFVREQSVSRGRGRRLHERAGIRMRVEECPDLLAEFFVTAAGRLQVGGALGLRQRNGSGEEFQFAIELSFHKMVVFRSTL
jgi:hypothetical protein